MSAKKAKRKKPLSSSRTRRYSVPVYEGEILRTYRFPTEPHDVIVRLHAILHKYMFLEDGRILARSTSRNTFETVLGFVDQSSAERTLENIQTNLKLDLAKWAVPLGCESHSPLEPIGYFFTHEDNEIIAAIVASDPTVVQAYKECIADRMDREGRNEGFVFRDLSEEEYKKIRAEQTREAN